MPVVQPVLGTNTYIYIYIYDHSGKSMPIDNYEQYKRVINQITGRLYMHIYIYILETKKYFYFYFLVCVWLFITVCF